MDSEPLHGGLVNRVVRVGQTVRRPAGPWTPAVHALLDHLEARGFPAPKARGIGDDGREILTYLPGEPALWPWPAVLREPDGIRQVGALIRRYHEALAGFAPAGSLRWQIGERALQPGEVVCHGDLNPSNLIWSGRALVGLIDWELAYPGSALRDLANAAWTMAPLCPDEDVSVLGFEQPPDRARRLAVLASAYGGVEPAELLAEVQRLQATELAEAGWPQS